MRPNDSLVTQTEYTHNRTKKFSTSYNGKNNGKGLYLFYNFNVTLLSNENQEVNTTGIANSI